MKTLLRLLILLIFLTSTINSKAQDYLSDEDAFLYYMKVYNFQPKDNTNNGSVHFGSLNWFTVYLMTYMPYEYNQVKDDEFKKKDFTKKAGGVIHSKLSNLDFNTQYIVDIKGRLGKYDFDSSSFKVYYSVDKFPYLVRNAKRLSVKIESIINKEDIDKKINISSDKARGFISSRKSSSGDVDRSVYLRFYYNMTKRTSSSAGINGYDKRFLKIYVDKIEVYNNESCSNLLGTIKSKRNWVDKINGRASNNGTNKYYYDRWWKQVESESDSRYYTEVVLKNGKHVNPVKTYYSRSRQVQSEANYTSVGAGKWRKADGIITWYYYSGKVEQTVEIRNGKWNGTLKKWEKEDGYLEEVSEYVNGKKHGCERKYNADGSCRIEWGKKEWKYYMNGKPGYLPGSCLCDEQGKQKTSTNTSQNKRKSSRGTRKTSSNSKSLFSQKYISPYIANFETSNTTVTIKKGGKFNDSHDTFLKIKDKVFNQMTTRLHKMSPTHFDNTTSITINVNKISYPYNEKNKSYSCIIDYHIKLKSNFKNPTIHQYSKDAFSTATTPIISLGYTKNGALEKASSKMVKKVNRFIGKNNPIGLEIIELKLGSDGRVKEVIAKKDTTISNKLYVRDFDVVNKSAVSVNFKVSKTIARRLEYKSQTKETVSYSVKKSKYQKALAKHIDNIDELILLYQ